jgi:GGDEF domain-containing protein
MDQKIAGEDATRTLERVGSRPKHPSVPAAARALAEPSSSRFEVEAIIDGADKCLYAAKEVGRNCTRYTKV